MAESFSEYVPSEKTIEQMVREILRVVREPPAEYQAGRSKALSEREVEVLQLLMQGKLNKEIARDLVITENTVAFHISNIFEKLNVRSRTQAAMRGRDLESDKSK